MAISTLPRIVRFLDANYSPDSTCPHCGARGAYIHRFQVEDGRTLGAMSGCVKLFPVSPVALEQMRLHKKHLDYRKKWPSFKPNRFDQEMLDTIEQFLNGQIDEQLAMDIINGLKRAAQDHVVAKRRR